MNCPSCRKDCAESWISTYFVDGFGAVNGVVVTFAHASAASNKPRPANCKVRFMLEQRR
jgi:hypothetical protein